MEGGDLSNEMSPRVIFVLEGLIMHPPAGLQERKERWMLRRHSWTKAVNTWMLDTLTVKVMWDWMYNRNAKIDIVTYMPEAFADAMQKRLDFYSVPYANFWSASPAAMARAMATMIDVIAVFDADKSRAFTYGARGRTVTPQMLARGAY